jgi:hypothetical protein
MNRQTRIIFDWLTLLGILAFLVSITLFFCGCSSVERKVFTFQTNAVPAVAVVPAATNTVVSGSNVVQIVTAETVVTNWTTNIVVAVRPVVQQTLTTIQAANELNPTPSAPGVNLALGVVSGLLGIWASMAQRRANKKESLLRTVVAGVEAAGQAATAVKGSIEATSRAVGNAGELDRHVQRIVE